MKIPKIIHYCWFGKNKKTPEIVEYMKTWEKLNGYRFIEWNETNFDINSNPFIKSAYDNKKWAFVSDYVRLFVLKEYGGIYIDTDVEIIKSFDDFLDKEMFLGMIFDCSIGTAVIGSIPNHPIINGLLEIYNDAVFKCENNISQLIFKNYEKYNIINNNDLFTIYFIKEVEGFKLCNKVQHLNNVTIYPKEYFEIGSFNKRINYSNHHCFGSWHTDSKKTPFYKVIVKKVIGKVLYSKLISYKVKRKLPFYEFYKK